MTEYDDFIQAKVNFQKHYGHQIQQSEINPLVKPHQKDIVQNHICPLQYDIVERLIRRYSNEGDLVFDPFGGIGTVPLTALRMGRRGRGVELNHGYFLDAIAYLQAEEQKVETPSLFDLLDETTDAA